MKRIQLLTLFILLAFLAHSQHKDSLSLQQCYDLAQQHYPLLQQDSLLEQKLDLAIQNLNRHYLPQLSLNSKASYQSAVTEVPIKVPGQNVPEVPKDQYRATLDLEQLVFDGGAVKQQKSLQKLTNLLESQQQDITFHQLKERLNEWFASALVLQSSEKMLNLQKDNLESQLAKARSAIKNGTLLPSDADQLEVSLLQLQQQSADIRSRQQATLKALSLVIGKSLNDSVYLILPDVEESDNEQDIQRPELERLALQKELLQQQSSLLQTQSLPMVSAFVQGGYGQPGLNMLSDQFDLFYLAGVRLKWNLWDWHQRKRKQQSLQIDAGQLQLQKKNFLLQTNIALGQEASRIYSLEDRIKNDNHIVMLREKIRKSASSKLQHGIITPTEYLILLNDETAARIQQQTHIIQLHFAKLNRQLLKSK